MAKRNFQTQPMGEVAAPMGGARSGEKIATRVPDNSLNRDSELADFLGRETNNYAGERNVRLGGTSNIVSGAKKAVRPTEPDRPPANTDKKPRRPRAGDAARSRKMSTARAERPR